ncbi:hypothetical protein I4U23_001908 [Adineta vaga]|nr:hypothetical protein I4U23_001908 [Adineta vaga]
MYSQKLSYELNTLTNEYTQNLKYSKKQHQIEQQRKEILDLTIQQISHERKHRSLFIDTISQKDENRGVACENPRSNIKLPPIKSYCYLTSQQCQLYPCQPIYQYTSFMAKDHDQTLRQQNLTNNDVEGNYFQNLLRNLQDRKYHPERRQLTAVVKNQHHLANRHAYMRDTKARLDEQSRLLHERLTDKRMFGYRKERQNELHQSIKRHLEISGKFCA